MTKYFLRRLGYFVPTLFFVVILLFFIKSALPGDPIEDYLSSYADLQQGDEFYLEEYDKLSKKWGYQKPPFYFTIQPRNLPDDHYSIIPLSQRNALVEQQISKGFSMPKLTWYGFENQFHQWFKGICRLDLGVSVMDGRPVAKKISKSLGWTFLLMFISLLIASLFSFPLGLWQANTKRKGLKKATEMIGFIFYSVPLFWLCLLALIFFASDMYGMRIFAITDIDPLMASKGFWYGFGQQWYKLILPALCWSLHSTAYLSTQLKRSIMEQRENNYVQTALAKGLDLSQVSRRHILKNAMLPIITIYFSTIPTVLAGSVVIETIFNIPGIGRLLVGSILNSDWNVVIGIALLSSFVTMCSFLIADYLYARVDPRIKYSSDGK